MANGESRAEGWMRANENIQKAGWTGEHSTQLLLRSQATLAPNTWSTPTLSTQTTQNRPTGTTANAHMGTGNMD